MAEKESERGVWGSSEAWTLAEESAAPTKREAEWRSPCQSLPNGALPETLEKMLG